MEVEDADEDINNTDEDVNTDEDINNTCNENDLNDEPNANDADEEDDCQDNNDTVEVDSEPTNVAVSDRDDEFPPPGVENVTRTRSGRISRPCDYAKHFPKTAHFHLDSENGI